MLNKKIQKVHSWLLRVIYIRNPIKYAKKIGVKVGEASRFVDHPNWGTEPWLISIGNHVLLSSEVEFVTHDGSTWIFKDTDYNKHLMKFGKIVVGDNTFIGTRSIILPNVNIGSNVIVAAGSVVTKDIPDGEVWGGIPAHFIEKSKVLEAKIADTMPEYDMNALRRNKKEEILRCLE